ncbi:MAG: hypothetical protein WC518_03370 [Patescibacteria group bacterium]
MKEKLPQKENSPEPLLPSEKLFDSIMLGIGREQKRQLRRRIFFYSLCFVCSLVALLPAFRAVRAEIINSGLIEFLALAISDSKIVLTYWNNFIFVVLEALPVISLVVFLAVIFVFLESLKLLARDLKTLLSPASITN